MSNTLPGILTSGKCVDFFIFTRGNFYVSYLLWGNYCWSSRVKIFAIYYTLTRKVESHQESWLLCILLVRVKQLQTYLKRNNYEQSDYRHYHSRLSHSQRIVTYLWQMVIACHLRDALEWQHSLQCSQPSHSRHFAKGTDLHPPLIGQGWFCHPTSLCRSSTESGIFAYRSCTLIHSCGGKHDCMGTG